MSSEEMQVDKDIEVLSKIVNSELFKNKFPKITNTEVSMGQGKIEIKCYGEPSFSIPPFSKSLAKMTGVKTDFYINYILPPK